MPTSTQSRSAHASEPAAEAARAVVGEYFARMQAGHAPEVVAELFGDQVDWDIPGDAEVVPWLGRRSSREGVAAFVRSLRELTLPLRFEVRSLVVEGERVVALGELETKVAGTGGVITSEFAFFFVVRDGKIVRFRLFEDSHAVSRAFRAPGAARNG